MSIIEFDINTLVDNNSNNYENFSSFKPKLTDRIRNFFHRGCYCVIRCGFFKGNYSIFKKTALIKTPCYFRVGENQIDSNDYAYFQHEKQIAYEGSYADCIRWYKLNQTYVERDY